jgi:SAM-dependent methyltransferase
MPFHSRQASHCRICGGGNLIPYLDLGEQPPSNTFPLPEEAGSEPRFPLVVQLCPACGLSQLTEVVAATDIFDDYAYLSSTSRALVNHYQSMVDQLLARFAPKPDSLIVDIGCNDGITLARYPNTQYRLLGVEPSSAGNYARERGFQVEQGFFDDNMACTLVERHGSAMLATATNVFAHVDDIRAFARGVKTLLAPDGVFVIEAPYLCDMIEELYFDTVYHEHLSYLAVTPLVRLFQEHGLRLFHVEAVAIGASGPALRFFVCHADATFEQDASICRYLNEEAAWGICDAERYRDFSLRVSQRREEILALLTRLRKEGYVVGAFGAPAKGNTLLNYLGVTRSDLIAVADNNPLKAGRVTPGSHIPIVDDAEFLRLGVNRALLLTWNYADFFVAESDFVKQGGRFVIPLPVLCIRPE